MAKLKDYLEAGKYNKGKFSATADSGAVFISNIQIDSNGLPVNPKNLVGELPRILQETALIDRIHGIIPGWELPRIQTSTLSNDVGFKADFIGEIFHALRNRVEFDKFVEERSNIIGTSDLRDKKAIMRMASGFLKLLFPNLKSINEDDYINYCLKPAIELRQRVRDQLHYLDPEYKNYVIEVLDPDKSHLSIEKILIEDSEENENEIPKRVVTTATKLLELKEGDLGYSYELLFSPFVKSSKEIKVVDPFIRLSYQIENLFEFCKMLATFKVTVLHLITGTDAGDEEQNKKNEAKFEELKKALLKKGIEFKFEFLDSLHDRYIETDDGWKITLGRGLDIFQKPESWFDLDKDNFQKRKCRSTIISYNRM